MATRKDVADKANVSVTAVSRVMNNIGYVSGEKREAVLKVAKELNYRPNPVAVSLQKNQTKQLLFYVKDLSNYYYMELYRGMMSYAQKKGYIVFISGDLGMDKIGSLMVDGVILSAEFFTQEKYTKYLHVPYVVTSHGSFVTEHVHKINVDTKHSMKMIIDYLRSKGHEKIAYASLYRQSLDPRGVTFRDKMKLVLKNNISDYILGTEILDEHLSCINYFQNGVLSAEQFINNHLDATSVICFNDDMAVGFNQRIQELGFKVPDDISIVGIDGQLLGQYTAPPLTSLSLHTQEHGEKCAKVLIDLIEGKKAPITTNIGMELIERSSVADYHKPKNE